MAAQMSTSKLFFRFISFEGALSSEEAYLLLKASCMFSSPALLV